MVSASSRKEEDRFQMIGYVVLGQYNFSKYHTIYLQSSGCQASLDAQPSVKMAMASSSLTYRLQSSSTLVPPGLLVQRIAQRSTLLSCKVSWPGVPILTMPKHDKFLHDFQIASLDRKQWSWKLIKAPKSHH